MATTKTSRTRKPATAKKAAAPAKKVTAKKAPVERVPRGKGPEAAKQTATILKRRAAGDSLATIASDLGITTGDAGWLVILNRVENNDPAPLTVPSDPAKLTALVKREREADGEFSAYHWIAARTGIAESQIKKIAEAGGFYKKGQNVAVARAAANPKAAPVAKKATTTKATAKKGARRTRRTADPS